MASGPAGVEMEYARELSTDRVVRRCAESDGGPEDLVDEVDDPIWQEMLDVADQFDFVAMVEFVGEDPPWVTPRPAASGGKPMSLALRVDPIEVHSLVLVQEGVAAVDF